jgi:hypothetical protein
MKSTKMRWVATSVYLAVVVFGCSNDSGSDGGSSGTTGNGGAGGSGGAGASGTGGDSGASGDSSSGAAGAPDGASGAAGGPSDSGTDAGCHEVRGCVFTGCAGDKICSTDPRHGCYPSSCSCAPDGQVGGCTADCGGGICVDSFFCVGCPLEFPGFGSDCSAYELGKVCSYATPTMRCDWHSSTSSGRSSVTCAGDGGAARWQ